MSPQTRKPNRTPFFGYRSRPLGIFSVGSFLSSFSARGISGKEKWKKGAIEEGDWCLLFVLCCAFAPRLAEENSEATMQAKDGAFCQSAPDLQTMQSPKAAEDSAKESDLKKARQKSPENCLLPSLLFAWPAVRCARHGRFSRLFDRLFFIMMMTFFCPTAGNFWRPHPQQAKQKNAVTKKRQRQQDARWSTFPFLFIFIKKGKFTRTQRKKNRIKKISFVLQSHNVLPCLVPLFSLCSLGCKSGRDDDRDGRRPCLVSFFV